jgi:hypothetical protein
MWLLVFGSWYLEFETWDLGLGIWNLEFGTWIFNNLIYPSSQYLFSPAVGVKAFSSVYNVDLLLFI